VPPDQYGGWGVLAAHLLRLLPLLIQGYVWGGLLFAAAAATATAAGGDGDAVDCLGQAAAVPLPPPLLLPLSRRWCAVHNWGLLLLVLVVCAGCPCAAVVLQPGACRYRWGPVCAVCCGAAREPARLRWLRGPARGPTAPHAGTGGSYHSQSYRPVVWRCSKAAMRVACTV
jgi:hypothetical protein